MYSQDSAGDRLRLTVWLDSDGTCELYAEASANGYSGRGAAWFSAEELREFAGQLSAAFPLVAGKPIEIRGGYWNSLPLNGLRQVHLHISMYPVGGRGAVGCRVHLETPLSSDDRPEACHTVTLELITSYAQLASFARRVNGLLDGSVQEAVLNAADS